MVGPMDRPCSSLVGRSPVPARGKERHGTHPSHFHPPHSILQPGFISQRSRRPPCPCSQRARSWGGSWKAVCLWDGAPASHATKTLGSAHLGAFQQVEGLEGSRDAYPWSWLGRGLKAGEHQLSSPTLSTRFASVRPGSGPTTQFAEGVTAPLGCSLWCPAMRCPGSSCAPSPAPGWPLNLALCLDVPALA